MLIGYNFTKNKEITEVLNNVRINFRTVIDYLLFGINIRTVDNIVLS